jgi:hypothetical protein
MRHSSIAEASNCCQIGSARSGFRCRENHCQWYIFQPLFGIAPRCSSMAQMDIMVNRPETLIQQVPVR